LPFHEHLSGDNCSLISVLARLASGNVTRMSGPAITWLDNQLTRPLRRQHRNPYAVAHCHGLLVPVQNSPIMQVENSSAPVRCIPGPTPPEEARHLLQGNNLQEHGNLSAKPISDLTALTARRRYLLPA
jgi:hypothetical protein